MSKKKIFTMAIDNWKNEVLSEAAMEFHLSKSKIVHRLLSFKLMLKIEKMTKEAAKVKWDQNSCGKKTREYEVMYRNFHRFLIGAPLENITCDECVQQNVQETTSQKRKENSNGGRHAK
jgi:hypothetical protein